MKTFLSLHCFCFISVYRLKKCRETCRTKVKERLKLFSKTKEMFQVQRNNRY